MKPMPKIATIIRHREESLLLLTIDASCQKWKRYMKQTKQVWEKKNNKQNESIRLFG